MRCTDSPEQEEEEEDSALGASTELSTYGTVRCGMVEEVYAEQ